MYVNQNGIKLEKLGKFSNTWKLKYTLETMQG